MALRMSQMLRSSGDLRRVKAAAPVAPRPQASAAQTPAALPVADTVPQIDLGPLESGAVASLEEAVAEVPSESATVGVYRQLVRAAEAVFTAAEAGKAPDGQAVVAAVRAAAAELRTNDDLLAETVRQRHDAREWPNRSANTSIMAMRLGLEIAYDDRRTLALGLCGLMHDVGMICVPQEVLDSQQLNKDQWELLRRHPAESHRLIQGFGKAFEWIAKIALQVHERFDGSGYPEGLAGEQIHDFARIIGLVDAYEAMAQPRADREARVVYNALKRIIDQRNSLFDRRFIRALIHIVSIFPLGSLVKLNNGEIGRVVGTSRSHPTRPTVDVQVDARGRRLAEPRRISLQIEPMLYVVDPAIEEGVLGEDS